jgi:hypothetical protein
MKRRVGHDIIRTLLLIIANKWLLTLRQLKDAQEDDHAAGRHGDGPVWGDLEENLLNMRPLRRFHHKSFPGTSVTSCCPNMAQEGLNITHMLLNSPYVTDIVETRILRPREMKMGRLHDEELHSLYRSPNIVRVVKSRILRWAGHVARMEEGRSAFKILTGIPTGKRPLGRHRRRY